MKKSNAVTRIGARMRPPWVMGTTLLAGLTLSGVLWWCGTTELAALPPAAVHLQPIKAEDADSLAALFAEHGYDWPPHGAVPPLAVASLPADLAEQPPSRKKSLFFRSLLPLILAENRRLQAERSLLKRAFAQNELPPEGSLREQVAAIALDRGISGDLDDPNVRAQLLRRVDRIPPALALAQAASESGWGSSRFAREGNNLFGERTWNPDQGLTPHRRASHLRHYVRAFGSLRGSVHSYVHNLNTHRAYAQLRQLREQRRNHDKQPDAANLVGGLNHYSERGTDYVADIRTMLRHNNLSQALQNVHLAATRSRPNRE
ncbi:MAG: glucosaminidase domain-containing protein [Nitrococcus mobilis]|nr:glucosaminidase domain-containing protein [Nitrococcus mobilis]